MQTNYHAEPSATGDRELDSLLVDLPSHLRDQLAEINRLIPSDPDKARWLAAVVSQHADAFERYGGQSDAEPASAVKRAAQYLITKAKNS